MMATHYLIALPLREFPSLRIWASLRALPDQKAGAEGIQPQDRRPSLRGPAASVRVPWSSRLPAILEPSTHNGETTWEGLQSTSRGKGAWVSTAFQSNRARGGLGPSRSTQSPPKFHQLTLFDTWRAGESPSKFWPNFWSKSQDGFRLVCFTAIANGARDATWVALRSLLPLSSVSSPLETSLSHATLPSTLARPHLYPSSLSSSLQRKCFTPRCTLLSLHSTSKLHRWLINNPPPTSTPPTALVSFEFWLLFWLLSLWLLRMKVLKFSRYFCITKPCGIFCKYRLPWGSHSWNSPLQTSIANCQLPSFEVL